VSSGATAIIDDVLSGTAGLNKTDGGTLVLTGTNVYRGNTTLSGGELSVSSDTNLGCNCAALDFEGGTLKITGTRFHQTSRSIVWGNAGGGFDVDDASNTFTVTQALTGSGGLLKRGGGTLVLAGANSYGGGTFVSAGTLQGDTTSLQGNIVNNATVVFAQQSDGIYVGAMSGSGVLIKTGSGTLVLNGANSYRGGTTISVGTLEVGDSEHAASASIEGAVQVQGSGTLRGHGTIVGDVTNDGMVWPGASVGVLTVQGNYVQNADGALQIDVTPTQASTLVVSGRASLAGTLNLVFAPGTYGTSTFPLVQASSVSGTFAKVNGTIPASVTSQLSYSGTDVSLLLTDPPASVTVQPLDGGLFGDMMRSVNIAGQQDMSSALDVALLPQATQCDADHVSPVQNVMSTSCESGAWAQYTGSSLSLSGANGLNSTSFGLLGGADVAVDDVAHVGLQAGVGQINGHDTVGGNGRAEDAHGGVYAYANAGPLVFSAVVDYMHSNYRFNRASGVGMATSAPSGNMLSGALQAAWPMQVSQAQFAPKVGALYQRQVLDRFGETLVSSDPLASNFPVSGARSSYTSLQPFAALSFERSFQARGVWYVPQLSLGYRYDTRNTPAPVVQVTAQDGTVFAMQGARQGRGMGTASARITAKAGPSWNLYMDYEGLFAGRLHDNALSFGFTKRF
jgi:autotransporter-associated beta strand protein